MRKTKQLELMAQTGLLLIFVTLLGTGCNQHTPGKNNSGNTGATEGSPVASVTEKLVPLDPQLHQSFAEAIRPDPPSDWQRPPDLTLAGKSVGKLYTDVVAIWDSIQFASPTGKPIAYRATMETDIGRVVLDMRPELAPNHVRNFVALALVHYYDGLIFERTIHAKSQEQPEVEVEVIEGGCPLGTGEIGQGSIGYWLKPEFSKEAHEAGTVSACHGEDPATAACRFYITLNKAPFLDGNFTVFAKVSAGLDVARRIFSLPVRNDPEYPEGDRPENPVVIRKVLVETSEAGGPWHELPAK